MEYELGGDRAVIIVSALVAILSSSTSVSKDNIGTEECLCIDNLFFREPEAVTTAKWRDVLEREQFSSRIVAISGRLRETKIAKQTKLLPCLLAVIHHAHSFH